MPRNGKGGKRTGSSGTAYSNRSDLNTAVPITTVPNQPYGVAAQQRAAQQAIPMAPTPVAPAAPAAPAAPTTLTESMPQVPQPLPGELPWLQSTSDINEPITAGVDFGAGAGSEAVANPTLMASQYLNAMNNVAAPSALLMDLVRAASLMGM